MKPTNIFPWDYFLHAWTSSAQPPARDQAQGGHRHLQIDLKKLEAAGTSKPAELLITHLSQSFYVAHSPHFRIKGTFSDFQVAV